MRATVGVLAAATAAVADYQFVQDLNTQGTLKLSWNYNSAAKTVDLKATATVPSGTTGGYLAIGFSPDGLMHSGDYIVGYPGCVRVSSNNGTKGNPPNGAAAFAVDGGKFAADGNVWTLSGVRPFAGGNAIVGTPQPVIFAAGSAAVVPASCDAEYTFANHHDLGGGGFVGSANVSFAPAPAPPAAGNYSFVPNAKCTSFLKLCYQGSESDITTVSTSDPVDPCGHDKSDVKQGNCADYGFGKFRSMDPVYKQVSLWTKSSTAGAQLRGAAKGCIICPTDPQRCC